MVLILSTAVSNALASQPVNTNRISVPKVPLETVFQLQAPHQPDFDSEVLAPLRIAQKAAQEAEAARLEQVKRDEEAAAAAQKAAEEAAAVPVVSYVKPVYAAPAPVISSGLIGSYGYASPYGNCVDLAKSFGKNQPGNPITWSISSRTPWIGAAALFYTNHVAIVVGIWGNGDVELAHANCPGCATRVSANSLRGFF